MKNNVNWDDILEVIHSKLNPLSYDTWFKETKLIGIKNNTMQIEVPMEFHKKILNQTYYDLIEEIVSTVTGTSYDIEFLSAEEIKPLEVLELDEVEEPENKNLNSNLKPEYTFENFVIGDSNRFAQLAALAVAEQPGKIYNPLFIYGKSGLGKTHLMHAIGNYIVQKSNKKVLYVTSEEFISDFIGINKKDENNYDIVSQFKEKYRNIDILMIDDIQFLSGKAATQDMFFHIFDHLHQNGKQIILTSDKAPADIQDIQERIVSRFKWGLSAEVKSPDFDTRKKIIVDKLHRDGIVLKDDMVDFLAGEVKSNVRELIGVINSVIAHSMISKSDLSLDLLKETINKIAANQKKTINIPYIQEVVCEYFGIQREQLLSKTRKREIALPRQLAMYFAKEYTNATFTKIGEEMGGKDHSTVMYACETIRDVSKIDKELKKYLKEIKDKIFE